MGFLHPFSNTSGHVIFKGPRNASVGWSDHIFLIIITEGKSSKVENKHFKENAVFLCQDKDFTLPPQNALNWKMKTNKQKQILCPLKTVCTKVIMKQKPESLSTAGHHGGLEDYGTGVVCRLIKDDFQRSTGSRNNCFPAIIIFQSR